MRRTILLALVALMTASAVPAQAAPDAFTCTLRVSLEEFPENNAESAAATIEASPGSTCTYLGVEDAVTVDSTGYTYDDEGCHLGTASGTIGLPGADAVFAYRRVGTAVKIDLIFEGLHYAGVWELRFVVPDQSDPNLLDEIAQSCNGAALDDPMIVLEGTATIS